MKISGEKTTMSRLIQHFYKILCIGFAIFFLICLLYYGLLWDVVTFSGDWPYYFLPMLWLFLLALTVYAVLFKKIYAWENDKKILFAIFFLNALPRIVLMLANFEFYRPTSDFELYWHFGAQMRAGDFAEVARRSTAFPWFGGLAVYNGLIARFFGDGILSFQIANIIKTSFICVLMYLISKPFAGKKVAIAAALIFSIYPSNIISSQITTNMHHVILYGLLAIYFLWKVIDTQSVKKSAVFSILSVLSISVAFFMHNSQLIYFVALVLFSLIVLIVNIKRKNHLLFKKIIIFLVIFITGYSIIPQVALQLMYRQGIIRTVRSEGNHFLLNVAIGTDPDAPGIFRNASHVRIISTPIEYHRDEILSVIRENLAELASPGRFARFLRDKAIRTWFSRDDHSWWYVHHYLAYYRSLAERGEITIEQNTRLHRLFVLDISFARMDSVVVNILFLLATIGLIFRRYSKPEDMLNLMLILIIGFFMVTWIGENQSRYRYVAMPSLIILASAGLFEAKRILLETKMKIAVKLKSLGRRA